MNNQTLIKEGLALLEQIDAHNPTAAGPTAVSHRLHTTPELTTTLIARRQAEGDVAHANLVQLFEKIDRYFDEEELRELCFYLQVDDENFGDAGKRAQARKLVKLMDRHGRLSELAAAVSKRRPRVSWQAPPQQFGGVDVATPLNVAVVVDVTRPTLRDVARFMDEEETAVNVLLLRQTNPGAFLKPNASWNGLVHAFSRSMNAAKQSFGGAETHFFLSAPGALIFGLGCIWSTVDEATVYHYEKGRYYPVLTVSRALR
jgi:hypothetical protein